MEVNLVEDLFAGRIIAIWEKIFPDNKVEEARKLGNDPKMQDHFEYLYNLMKQREQRNIYVSTARAAT
jgi:hypothetical protein